jgi:hypothetical protein
MNKTNQSEEDIVEFNKLLEELNAKMDIIERSINDLDVTIEKRSYESNKRSPFDELRAIV